MVHTNLPLTELTTEQLKALYEAIKDKTDPYGYHKLKAAEGILGRFEASHFAYEDNQGFFEDEEDGCHREYRALLVDHAHEFGEENAKIKRWEIVPGTCYEQCKNWLIREHTPEFKAFEEKLYCELFRNAQIIIE